MVTSINKIGKRIQNKKKINAKKEQKKGKSLAILGDSMVKHLNGWEMCKKIKKCKVYVRSFPGAKVQCMEDYKKRSIRDEPETISSYFLDLMT